MKVNDDIRRRLHAAISPLDTEQRRERYRAGDFYNADKVKDLNKRYRWDLLWLATDGTDIVDAVYAQGANDNHLDTVLRRIVAPLEVAS